jgi:hypothetical protein
VSGFALFRINATASAACGGAPQQVKIIGHCFPFSFFVDLSVENQKIRAYSS